MGIRAGLVVAVLLVSRLCVADVYEIHCGTIQLDYGLLGELAQHVVEFNVPIGAARVDSVAVTVGGAMPIGVHHCYDPGGYSEPSCNLFVNVHLDGYQDVFGDGMFVGYRSYPVGDFIVSRMLGVNRWDGSQYQMEDILPGELDGIAEDGQRLWVYIGGPAHSEEYCTRCRIPESYVLVGCEIKVYYTAQVAGEETTWSEVKQMYR
jgi:hypothetical protein